MNMTRSAVYITLGIECYTGVSECVVAACHGFENRDNSVDVRIEATAATTFLYVAAFKMIFLFLSIYA